MYVAGSNSRVQVQPVEYRMDDQIAAGLLSRFSAFSIEAGYRTGYRYPVRCHSDVEGIVRSRRAAPDGGGY